MEVGGRTKETLSTRLPLVDGFFRKIGVRLFGVSSLSVRERWPFTHH